MAEITNFQWVLIAALLAVHVLTCVHTAAAMRRIGRNPIVWFCISLLLTSIPAAICTARHRLKSEGPADQSAAATGSDQDVARTRKCPHCGELIAGGRGAGPEGLETCPNCKRAIEEDYLA